VKDTLRCVCRLGTKGTVIDVTGVSFVMAVERRFSAALGANEKRATGRDPQVNLQEEFRIG